MIMEDRCHYDVRMYILHSNVHTIPLGLSGVSITDYSVRCTEHPTHDTDYKLRWFQVVKTLTVDTD